MDRIGTEKAAGKKGQSRMMCKNSGADLAIIPGLLGGLDDEELNALAAEARKIGEITKISVSEAAAAITNMAMVGWNSNQITESTSLMEKNNENLTDQFINIIENGKEETHKMKRKVNGAYLTTRETYKKVKKFDHQQLDEFCTKIYTEGYRDGAEAAPGVDLTEVITRIGTVKGIGATHMERIKAALADLFEKDGKEEKPK